MIRDSISFYAMQRKMMHAFASLLKCEGRTFSQFNTAVFLFLAITGSAHAMEALNDSEMGGVTGQEGVMVSMEYYYNAIRTDDPATTGQGLSKCTNSGLGDMDCRLAWQLSNRGNAAVDGIYASTTWTLPGGGGCNGNATCRGEWLVWKGGWSSVAVKDLMLDAASLGDAISSGPSYEAWLGNYDAGTPSNSTGNMVPVYGSFVDNSGSCLMPAGYGTSPCTVAYMKAMPALRTHYPNTGGTYTPNGTGGVTSGFDDVRFGLEVTGLSAEYDDGSNAGWMLNNGGSFTSLKIADNNFAHQAGIAFGGSFYLYGF